MPRGLRVVNDVNENPKKDVHNLSIEKQGDMYISMQKTIMNLQNEIRACKEKELNRQCAMELQNIEMKGLHGELHVMKNQSRMLGFMYDKKAY